MRLQTKFRKFRKVGKVGKVRKNVNMGEIVKAVSPFNIPSNKIVWQ